MFRTLFFELLDITFYKILEKEMYSSLSTFYLPVSIYNGAPLQYLAWKIPWTEEPGRLQFMGSRRFGNDWVTSVSVFTFHFPALEKEMATHSSVLAWRIPGRVEPGGLPFMGLHRIRYDWSDLVVAASI